MKVPKFRGFRTKAYENCVIFGTAIFFLWVVFHVVANGDATTISRLDILALRDEAKDMFYHAYNAYMYNAFPADELMPLSCRGRVRGIQPDRGDIDDALGNFSMTLIDSLDTLAVLGDISEFEHAVKLVIDKVAFDHDLSVSVFETNIRIIGGLISGHVLAQLVNSKGRMKWYQGELLTMALDVGTRLLPAFNSTTGLPYPRVNLIHGMKEGKVKGGGETCTACAGTMILEFAALSRLSGEPIFEEKAARAMDVLWASRHRISNLVGNVLNVQTGDWVRRDSGIGAGIDSYYEYVAKAYVLLGEEKYFDRWNTHYAAIMKYLGRQGRHVMQDVHMHRPHATSKSFVDALGAFWPGLQVLMGDLRPAIESHEVLYQVMQRHHFIPEAFTTDFRVHWGQHFLRPEFVESTYFLYKATKDPHYLDVGRKILRSLQQHARVTCGYATIKDVRTLQKEDRMDSFVLSETFKYLYLLFADEADLPFDLNNFVFTTEGHLLPLSLARLSNRTVVPLKEGKNVVVHDEDVEFARSCPSTAYLFPEVDFVKHLRESVGNVVEAKCPREKTGKRRLLASEFQSGNNEHLSLVRDMGIKLMSLKDGRLQLFHSSTDAKSEADAEEGLAFMHEMIELSKSTPQAPGEKRPKLVSFKTAGNAAVSILAGAAQFGRDITDGSVVRGEVTLANPFSACDELTNSLDLRGKIVVVERGGCMFVVKARALQRHGAKAGIVVDDNPGTTSKGNTIFTMSGDGNDDVGIPMVFLFREDAVPLMKAVEQNDNLKIAIREIPLSNSAKNDEAVAEEESSFDFTSPFSQLLERSRQQVNRYLAGVLSSVDGNEDKCGELNVDDPDTLLDLNSEEEAEDIQSYVSKHPRLVSMLLGTKFSDLVLVFNHFWNDGEDGDAASAYVKVFDLLEAEGPIGMVEFAEKLKVKPVFDQDDHDQEQLVEQVLTKHVGKLSYEAGDRAVVSALLDLVLFNGVKESQADAGREGDDEL